MGAGSTIRLWELVISLKRLLADDDEGAAHARAVWVILEAVACHAVEADPGERLTFQTSLRQLVKRMEDSKTSDGTLVLAGEAIHTIETYHRGVQRSIGSQMKELQAIVSLFMRSMLQLSKGSAASAATLRHLERQIENASQAEDLRTIKAQLEQSLATICNEATEQERRSEQIHGQIRETMSRPEAAAMSEAVGDLDMATGLPNFESAQTALRAAIADGTKTFAVLLCVDRVEAINSRFGASVGDRVLMTFGQHLAQRFSQSDRLLRWRGPSFLALIDRKGPETTVRAEVARVASARLEQQIELAGRSVLLPVAASWMLTSIAASTPEEITQKLDAFAAGHAGAPAN